MNDDRAPGPTFAIEDIGFIDFEAKSLTSIKNGTCRYANDADAIILAYAIGEGPVRIAAVKDFEHSLLWSRLPRELHEHHERVLAGEAVWAAWNAGFDRAIWNYATLNFPFMEPHHIIDVMAQATASGFAGGLDMAAKQCHAVHKDVEGSDLIKLFCLPGSTATPQTHPDQWQRFCSYATTDIEAMRGVFLGSRQLPWAEWREYWAMEAINERGVRIDLPMVEHAAVLAAEDRSRSTARLSLLTEGAVTSVDQVARVTAWLLDRLPAEGQEILLKSEEETDEEGVVIIKAKFSLPRRKVERLLALCRTLPGMDDVISMLQIRLYGGSKTPAKFRKILDQHVDGVLYGQYVFNGAAQTGRASSKGIQLHNLARDVNEDEPELIDALLRQCSYEQFTAIGDDSPVARKLSLLIRSAFVAGIGTVLVWSDWSQIEARIVPWLADYQAGAEERLRMFRAVDADPDLPDLYTRTAAAITRMDIAKITKPIRQCGKISELALGFCGGVNALQNMAAGFGMHFSDVIAREIVTAWRQANPWVAAFAADLWNAMKLARREPGTPFRAGRITFIFMRDLFGGSLFCELPSGRFLTYRALREELCDVLDDDGKVIDRRPELTFARGYGRVKLWPGMLVENFTQATAADVLRGTLVRLEEEGFHVRCHVHDEILVETEEREGAAIALALREVMQRGFSWSEGLPLMSEESLGFYYTKADGMTWSIPYATSSRA